MRLNNSSCESTRMSYACTALILAVIFCIPIVMFLASGFSIDVQGYTIKDQSMPIEAFPGIEIPEDIISQMDITSNDVVLVNPSYYETTMQMVKGFVPWLVGLLIILTPLSEFIQYFVNRRKGQDMELVVGSSSLPILAHMFVPLIGGALVMLVGEAATYSQGLPLETVCDNISSLMIFANGMFWAVAIAIVLWLIPIVVQLVTDYRNSKKEYEDEIEEFFEDEKISER